MSETLTYRPEAIVYDEDYEPVVDLAISLGVNPTKLSGLPNDVLTACLMLTHYDIACAVKDFVDRPESLMTQVKPALDSYTSQASHDTSEIRRYLAEERDTMIAFHAKDADDAELLSLLAEAKQREFSDDAKGHFDAALVDVMQAARVGAELTEEYVNQQFAVVAIDVKQISEKLGVVVIDTPAPAAEDVQDSNDISTSASQNSANFAKIKITTARVGGVAAASAIVITGITAGPANAEEASPTPTPAQTTNSVSVQVVGPDGSIESSTTINVAPQPDAQTETPQPSDVVQPADVAGDQQAPPATQTTINPLTGKSTETTDAPAPADQMQVRSLDQNTSLANSAIDTLQPGFKEGLVMLQQAVAHKSLNALSHSDSDVYGTKDPATGKTIPLPLSGEDLKNLDAQYQLLQAILANDTTYITFVNAMFDAQPLDANKQAIIDTVAKTKFTIDGVDDLTSDQKTALLAYTAYISNETNIEAHKVVDKVISDYEKKKAEEERKKAETPPANPGERKVAPADRYSLLMPKIVDRQKVIDAINKYIQLRAPDSPYTGKGEQIVKGAELDGTNPLMTVVIGFMESRLSTRGVAAHYNTYNMWNRDCPDGKPRVHYKDGRSGHSHSACTYDSPDQALLQTDYPGAKAAKQGHDRFSTYLKRKFLNHGITTLIPFLAKYTPAAESSSKEHNHLINGYKNELDFLSSLIGDAIEYPVKLSTVKDLPKNVGSRYTTKEIANSAKPGDTMFGPNDPCNSLIGNVRILCSAKKYFGTRYGTADPAYAPHWSRVWGQKITSWGGHGPRSWIIHNKKNSTNDFLECSGYVAVAIAGAFNVDVDHCSAGFLSDKKNFKKINPKSVKPGDLVIATPWCGGKQGGHVAIVKSYNANTGELVTYEASAGTSNKGYARVGEIRTRKIGVDFHYAARYIGPGSDADMQSNAA